MIALLSWLTALKHILFSSQICSFPPVLQTITNKARSLQDTLNSTDNPKLIYSVSKVLHSTITAIHNCHVTLFQQKCLLARQGGSPWPEDYVSCMRNAVMQAQVRLAHTCPIWGWWEANLSWCCSSATGSYAASRRLQEVEDLTAPSTITLMNKSSTKVPDLKQHRLTNEHICPHFLTKDGHDAVARNGITKPILAYQALLIYRHE